ncbi:MAG: hypothetical protein WD048_12960 [Chitinophagales bacterium]
MQNLTVKTLLLNIIILIPLLLSAQQASTSKYELLKSYPCSSSVLGSDRLGNAYVIKSKNNLVKLLPDGTESYNFNIVKFGQIGQIDTRNPLNLLVFFPDYASLVLLDNTLSIQTELSLYTAGINQVSAVCLAYDNNIWVYDQVTLRLVKIDQAMKIIANSEDFSSIFPYEVNPNFMMERDNLLFLNDPEVGILVFDIYGTFKKSIPIKNINSFQYVSNQILYFRDNRFYSYNLNSLNTREIPLPEYPDDMVKVHMQKERIYLLRKNQLDLYSFK